MKNERFKIYLGGIAVAGNILFVLWILFNAMDDGFKGTLHEKLSAIGLIGLLSINCILILSKKTSTDIL